ncbi:hypothetical protein [Deinococcus marmoris]|uniref:Uncharacterized protein n=1 Tax=Deinococcus marmoris TaxID=249408 RepID=A0A1U7P4V0_9DEIO|nr:hypothetical protein [Deinococcus marmoris]OLV20205.1 hypothetical protein BOO71_0000643 [Deinococcus marmoris]
MNAGIPPRLRLEAALLAALDAGPAGLTGVTGKARLQVPGYLQLLDHETAVRSVLRRLDTEGWLAVEQPGANPRYSLTLAGHDRHLWHVQQGTLCTQP